MVCYWSITEIMRWDTPRDIERLLGSMTAGAFKTRWKYPPRAGSNRRMITGRNRTMTTNRAARGTIRCYRKSLYPCCHRRTWLRGFYLHRFGLSSIPLSLRTTCIRIGRFCPRLRYADGTSDVVRLLLILCIPGHTRLVIMIAPNAA